MELRLEDVETRLKLEQQAKGGSSWFLAIAGFSALNSILLRTGVERGFVTGLGVTQVLDAVGMLVVEDLTQPTARVISAVVLIADLLISCLFLVIGVFARKRSEPAYVIGAGLYALDTLILAALGVWIPFFFHLFALAGLYAAYRGASALNDVAKGLTDLPSLTALRAGTGGRRPVLGGQGQVAFLLLAILFFVVVLLIIIATGQFALTPSHNAVS